MSHALTETPARGSAVNVPDAGDARTAASVATPMQALANRIAYLEAHGANVSAASFKQFPMACAINDDLAVAGGWFFTGGVWTCSVVSPTAILYVDLDIPVGVTLTRVGIATKGTSGAAHAGNVGNPPVITLSELDPNGTVSSSINVTFTTSATDPTGGNLLSGYDGVHSIEITGLTQVVRADRRYQLKIAGEHGTNSAANKFIIFGAYASWLPP